MGALTLATAGLALAGPAHATGNPTQNVLPPDCDRACLTDALTAVIDAMVAKDISTLPLGNDVISSQNGVKMRLDDGVWQVTDGLGNYRIDFIDPEAGQAGSYATIQYGGRLALMALRIAIWEQKIHEIEIIVSQGTGGGPMGDSGKQIEATGDPRPQLMKSLPAAQRMSRDDLIRVADSYFANLQGGTGKTTAPFTESCVRLENGFRTSLVPPAKDAAPGGLNILAMSCTQQQASGFFPFVTSIRDRRYPVVDREKGIVMSFGFFDHSGTTGEITLPDGRTIPSPMRTPTSFMMSESFQIENGKIDQVEAVMASAPYKMRNAVWTEGDRRVRAIGVPTGQ